MEANDLATAAKRAENVCSVKAGTMYEGLRSLEWQITTVIALLANGDPVQAMVRVFGLDKCTVARWIERAGTRGEQVQSERMVQQGLDLQHVQADEGFVKCDHKVV